MKDTISIEPVGPIPITPPPAFATFAVTPDGVIVQLPAPVEVTTKVQNPPLGTLLIVNVTFEFCEAIWFGDVL